MRYRRVGIVLSKEEKIKALRSVIETGTPPEVRFATEVLCKLLDGDERGQYGDSEGSANKESAEFMEKYDL